jgi:hypothetical protein
MPAAGQQERIGWKLPMIALRFRLDAEGAIRLSRRGVNQKPGEFRTYVLAKGR